MSEDTLDRWEPGFEGLGRKLEANFTREENRGKATFMSTERARVS